ncbi:glucose 1-dehydrogenase [Pseudomonas sp. H11T01]|uniref:glucose 1-dehydrogenase n=1 Tax=Pseudomonas sp. H11T01 TaxID=3402749 RepID=UPI003ACBF2CF
MSFDFSGKVVLITGGGTGIGRATAQAFAKAGANVVIADRDEKEGMETLALIGGEERGRFVKADVTRLDDMEAAVKSVLAVYGRLDIAFNNAGIPADSTPLAEVEPKNWERILSIDLTGVYHSMKAEIPAMVAQGGGVIVNTASVTGIVGVPSIAPYVAAKHGVVGLTKSAALDYAKVGVRINAVLPGPVDTELMRNNNAKYPEMATLIENSVPMGRYAQVEEIADAVLFLSSDMATYITGHSLVVDGGMTVQ